MFKLSYHRELSENFFDNSFCAIIMSRVRRVTSNVLTKLLFILHISFLCLSLNVIAQDISSEDTVRLGVSPYIGRSLCFDYYAHNCIIVDIVTDEEWMFKHDIAIIAIKVIPITSDYQVIPITLFDEAIGRTRRSYYESIDHATSHLVKDTPLWIQSTGYILREISETTQLHFPNGTHSVFYFDLSGHRCDGSFITHHPGNYIEYDSTRRTYKKFSNISKY